MNNRSIHFFSRLFFQGSAFFLLLLSGCVSNPTGVQGPEAEFDTETLNQLQVEPRLRGAIAQAERALKARDYRNAVQLFSAIRQKNPRTRAALIANYRLGTIYYYNQEYPRASQIFREFLKQNPPARLRFDATYNLAASEYEQGNFMNARQVLQSLTATDLQNQGEARAEIARKLMAQVDSQLNLTNEMATTTPNIPSTPVVPTAAAVTTSIPFEEGSLPTESSAAAPLTDFAARNSAGEPKHIGVVLPMSGKNAAYGERALDGIMFATQAYGAATGEKFQVFVEDTESSPAVAGQAVDKLVRERQVMAILGPISWSEAVAVSDRAEQLGVPNLTLTSKAGLSRQHSFTFQNALTPRVQLQDMVKYAIQNRQMSRFAILAPKNSFGADMVSEFWSLVEENGGIIVGYETYEPGIQDFQDSIRALVGLKDLRLRPKENAAFAKWQKENEKKPRASKSRVPPIVDFDGLFVPDQPGPVAQIAASMAYFDADKVTLLGTTEWNSDSLYRRGGRHVEGALFPGTAGLSSKNPITRDFVRDFNEAFGQMPDLLATQSYEAMMLVASALRRAGGTGRGSLAVALSQTQEFDSPLGRLSFDPSRIAMRNLPVLSLLPGGVISPR